MWKSLVFFVSVSIWSFVSSQECTTPTGSRSNCVSLYDCQPLFNAFEQRPLPSHVVSYLRRSQCGFEGYVPRVCCGPLPSQQEATSARPTPGPTQAPTQGSSEVFPEDSTPTPKNQCGVDTTGDRVYGGTITDLDEFPWMALLGYRTNKGTITYQLEYCDTLDSDAVLITSKCSSNYGLKRSSTTGLVGDREASSVTVHSATSAAVVPAVPMGSAAFILFRVDAGADLVAGAHTDGADGGQHREGNEEQHKGSLEESHCST